MATDEGQQAINGISRRSVLRDGLLAGAGVATAGAASAMGIATANALTTQLGWAHCNNCATMFWAEGANGASNVCAASYPSILPHATQAGSYKYSISYGPGYGNTTQPQGNWRWCGQCAAMFWNETGNGSAGACAAEVPGGNPPGTPGPHQAGSSTIYDLGFGQSGLGTTTNPQAYWYWCYYCSQLFWPGPQSSSAGVCPWAPGQNFQHVAATNGANYDLDHSGTW